MKRLTPDQQTRNKDIGQHEPLAFLRLIQAIKKYEVAKHLYVLDGDEDAYSTLRATRTEIRGYVNRLSDVW